MKYSIKHLSLFVAILFLVLGFVFIKFAPTILQFIHDDDVESVYGIVTDCSQYITTDTHNYGKDIYKRDIGTS